MSIIFPSSIALFLDFLKSFTTSTSSKFLAILSIPSSINCLTLPIGVQFSSFLFSFSNCFIIVDKFCCKVIELYVLFHTLLLTNILTNHLQAQKVTLSTIHQTSLHNLSHNFLFHTLLIKSKAKFSNLSELSFNL